MREKYGEKNLYYTTLFSEAAEAFLEIEASLETAKRILAEAGFQERKNFMMVNPQ